ncbi:MAG TPA: prephenate dehydratase [Thermoanaerobaculia bacterium]|nr:prephenate dehydratase [Thermoanaerobaculia bacterium]
MSEQIRAAYQGERGAFSESAARRLLGAAMTGIPSPSFESMFAAVRNGEADCCVAPIENSLAGSIHRNYDLVLESDLTIIGETNLRIVHHLIAAPDADLAGLRRVYSHPVALAQCTRFFAAHPGLEPVAVHDTAGAARLVLERGQMDEAAIASADAASIYGGRVLAAGIEDHPQNFTRFLLLTPRESGIVSREEGPRRWKTSLMFRVANKPGSLFRALGAFAVFDIDLSKIESRPVAGKPWEYAFYLDVIGRDDDPKTEQALNSLRAMAEMVRVLGCYPTRW